MRDFTRPKPKEVRDIEWFSQRESEFSEMLQHITKGPILEIGSRYGESINRIAVRVPEKSRIVCVDLAQDPYTKEVKTLKYLQEAVRKLERYYDTHLIVGNSHYDDTMERVAALGPYEFAFIDGDHEYTGVKLDWLMYSPFCKTIALHDIGDGGPKMLFDELKRKYRHESFIVDNVDDGLGPMGIGIIFK